MDGVTFFGLERVAGRWRMPVVPALCTGGGFLFGGCGLGAAIEVMEQVTQRPCVWATAQFLSYARPPSVLELDVLEVVRGRRTSQARVIAHVGDNEILTVLGALGERPNPEEGQWAVRPDVPPPDQCEPREHHAHHDGTIRDRLEERVANIDGTGNSALWVRLPEFLEVSAGALAIVGDFVPFGISQALARRGGGNSLDNTLRIVRRVPTEWVLADVRVHAIANGFGHGLVHLWGEDGTLLATASQSTIVRGWRERA